MSEVGVEIIKTKEIEKSGIKYLNINVSNSEVERKPDIVRLCSDAGIIEYFIYDIQPKTDVLDKIRAEIKEESRFCPLTEGLDRALEIINKYTAEKEK